MEISCNIIDVFTVTLDQFNASLVKKGLIKKNLLTPNIWIVVYILKIL